MCFTHLKCKEGRWSYFLTGDLVVPGLSLHQDTENFFFSWSSICLKLYGSQYFCTWSHCSIFREDLTCCMHVSPGQGAQLLVASLITHFDVWVNLLYRPIAKLWPLINACCYGNEKFWTLVLTQVIIKPNLRLVIYSADFIKILEEFPIGLHCGW